jgi:putative iron-regulated protein
MAFQRLARVLIALAVWCCPLEAANTRPDLMAWKHSVVEHYAAIVAASYADALDGARALAEAVDVFLAAPDAETLERARQAWIDARVPYVQTEAYRFYDGPIERVEGLVNSWPIDENLIDYVEGDPNAGIVNHPERFPTITRALLVSLNEKGGEKNITTGFHAIEFLLWGQDLNERGPGQRSHLDYVDRRAPHADRRREYLRVVTHLLVEHLAIVADAWAPGRGNYREQFLAMPPDAALADMIKGIGILSGAELSGERLTVPYETKEQEDEHSCFSDTTDRDIVNDAAGIENVFLGRYGPGDAPRVPSGPSVRGLLERIDPALAKRLESEIARSVAAARAVPAPFDRAIVGPDTAPGRVAVKTLIAALRTQADSMAQAGSVLGLDLNF